MAIFNIKDKLIQRFKKYKVQYIQLALLSIIIDLFCRYSSFYYKKKEEKNYSNLRREVNRIINGCFIRVKDRFLQKISNFVKGENYVPLNSPSEKLKFRTECIISIWNMFHFFSHAFFTFLFPYFYREIFLGSFLYEIYEYFAFKCHDISDVIYNVMGIFLGYKLRKMYDKYNKK